MCLDITTSQPKSGSQHQMISKDGRFKGSGWIIVRSSENNAQEFAMIYDIPIPQLDHSTGTEDEDDDKTEQDDNVFTE